MVALVAPLARRAALVALGRQPLNANDMLTLRRSNFRRLVSPRHNVVCHEASQLLESISMRAILTIVATIVALGSTAAAQEVVTPSNPLGQGFTPNGLQSTPSGSGQTAALQLNQGQTPNEAGLHLYQQNGLTGPKLNWLYSEPAASARTLPERPVGPLR